MPCLINGENQAVLLQLTNTDFHRIKSYVESISEGAGLRTRYEPGRIGEIDCVLVR